MNLFIMVIYSFLSLASTEIEDAKKSVQSLIYPLLQSKNKPSKELDGFRVDQCEKKKINWTNVLLMKETVTMNFKFKEGCDIEGTVEPKIFQTFPAELKLKNIPSYSNIKSTNRITADLQVKPILNLAMTEGTLTGKNSSVKFEADYQVQMNPMNRSNPVEKNLGGEIRILSINGKKTDIKEKILVK